MEGSGYVLPVVSHESRRRSAHRIRLSSAVRLSTICISRDLRTDEPLTLCCLVNEKHSATGIIDLGASSQLSISALLGT